MIDVKNRIKNFLDDEGRLTAYPAKRKMKIIALCYLAGSIEPDKKYTEKEMNALINSLHTFGDPATLRRELYDYKFIGRERDGSCYWLETNQPDIEALLSAMC